MTGLDESARFACHGCGSPSIVIPAALSDDALVTCGGCESVLGSWRSYKSYVSRSIFSERDVSVASMRFCADPIVAGPLEGAL